MRDFLLNHGPLIVSVLCALELLFGILLFARYRKSNRKVTLWMALISLALCYDACVLAIGSYLPEGLLRILSQFRFIFHGCMIPLLLPICVEALHFKKNVKTIVYVVTAVIMIIGAACGVMTKFDISNVAGITRCLSAKATPKFADTFLRILSYGTVVPLILGGIFVWLKQKTPALFLSGLLMFAFSALGPATGNFDLIFLIGMFGELFMILFFYVYARIKETNV